MLKTFLLAAAALVLSGCIVVPAGQRHDNGNRPHERHGDRDHDRDERRDRDEDHHG